jgi:hypothetical protein
VRSLLSEGCVRYETVEKGKDGELKTRLVEREGPTGLIVSTTSVSLHPENETRLLSLTATDTSDQTRLVLTRLAADDVSQPDFARWHDLQVWLATAEHRVSIPYALPLAELVPPVAVRLRRDFRAVLSLIRSHALLHQASRERDAAGKVIATFEDYTTVRELVVDIVSEGVEATVPATVRELVEAVAASEEPLSIAQLAQLFNLDKSATSRRWQNARARGYLRNLEERRGKPAQIVVGDPLPHEIEILPSLGELAKRVDALTQARKQNPLPPHAAGEGSERDILADIDDFVSAGVLIPVGNDLRWVPASHQPSELESSASIQIGQLAANDALCRYVSHRQSDWQSIDGRAVCGICHPPPQKPANNVERSGDK